MTVNRTKSPLCRSHWTLERYLSECSPAPMPPVVRSGDDALHIAKLALGAPLPSAVYVVDDEDHYLGTITDVSLALEVFVHLDPGLYLEKHKYATTGLLHLVKDASSLTAGSLLRKGPRAIRESETLVGAMRMLYHSGMEELPVVDRDGRLVGIIRALDILREWLEDTLLVKLGDETESFY